MVEQHPPLTDVLLRAAKPPERGTTTLWDGTLKHFRIRISSGGAKSFIILLGSGRRQAIGRYPAISLAKAREKAKAILAERTLGKHRPNSISWKKALELYLADAKTKNRPRTYNEYERALRRYFPFGDTKLADITKQDISAKLARLSDTPSQQKHAAVYLKTFFNWVVDQEYLTANPLQSFKQGKAKRRKRVLNDDEVRAVSFAADQVGDLFGAIVKLVLLTGQRRGEIAALLDTFYSHNQQTITLPGTLTKNHLDHTFPVGPIAAALISAQLKSDDRRDSAFLFPSRTSIERPFNGWSKCKRELDTLANIAPWTLHDLRRTFRSRLGRLGVRPDIAERLVNHV
ncbi:tyrosine-type recombinase/integrase [Bradyrhizobium sp. CIAT3101]|uniref:tyrosine-type recombinase/integrase n=1 Tax=Bradyrhizobium sp. CIAT3101 TaxID=439387 RepID=UPI0024B1310C|nr:integrase arm-type DNA-binding domain-containing protein [Bradyrhizobium sp. CIAT3101]WFU79180.1 tyrosine-type recombinase/integrase [Bradyrhizobium sp. CIAT3101]